MRRAVMARISLEGGVQRGRCQGTRYAGRPVSLRERARR